MPGAYFNEQVSQEFQLLWDDGGALSGLLGFYYLDAKADTLFDVRIFTTFAGLTAYTQANVDTETFAIFGDFTYDLTDQFSLSVGGRYTWDERSAEILRQNYLGGGSPVFGGAGVPFGGASTDFNGSREFKKFTPRASLSFMPTPDHNIYASYSKGFKGGGFDPRGVGVNAPAAIAGSPTDEEVTDFLSFAPEEVDSYEIGYKGNLGILNIAAAAFYADYTDVQIPGSVACEVGGLPTFCGIVSNAGKATFKGLELEASAFRGGFGLAGSLGYIDAQYDEYITNIANVPPTSPIPRGAGTPELTGSLTASYDTARCGRSLSGRRVLSQQDQPVRNPQPLSRSGRLRAARCQRVYRHRVGAGSGPTARTRSTRNTRPAATPLSRPTRSPANRQRRQWFPPTLGPEGTPTAFTAIRAGLRHGQFHLLIHPIEEGAASGPFHSIRQRGGRGGGPDRDAVGGRIVGEAFIHFVCTQAELGQAVAVRAALEARRPVEETLHPVHRGCHVEFEEPIDALHRAAPVGFHIVILHVDHPLSRDGVTRCAHPRDHFGGLASHRGRSARDRCDPNR